MRSVGGGLGINSRSSKVNGGGAGGESDGDDGDAPIIYIVAAGRSETDVFLKAHPWGTMGHW